MIEAKQLIKQFGKLRALDGLSIQVPEGSIYGLVGPNGAGKSTLIRCLTGVYRPEQGAVTLDGEPVWENPGVKRKMACIPVFQGNAKTSGLLAGHFHPPGGFDFG